MNLKGMDELKEGDTVFVVTPGASYQSMRIFTVSKVTPKQFHAKLNNYECKFRRSDGREISSSREWFRMHAYPDNPKNREEYNDAIEEQRRNDRARDLLGSILVAVKKLREEDLEKMEQIAAILGVEEEE